MENRAHALAAGIFTLLLGLAAGMFVWWLGQTRQDVNYFLLETRGNVTGLNLQAQVRYRGIRAGRVESVDIDERDPRVILVRISLDSHYRLTKGTTAKLNSQGVTGLSYVQLEDDGDKPEPLSAPAGETPRIALSPTLLETLGNQADDIASQIGVVAVRIAQLLDERNMRNLARSLDNVAIATEGLRELPQVVGSLRQALSDANVRKLSAALAGIERTAGEAAPLAHDMREMVRTMTTLAARIESVSGEAGAELTTSTLPRVNALMQELSGNARQLSRLIDTLERDPQVLVFGRDSLAPGPGEAGFVSPSK